jgi:hypothetical protein
MNVFGAEYTGPPVAFVGAPPDVNELQVSQDFSDLDVGVVLRVERGHLGSRHAAADDLEESLIAHACGQTGGQIGTADAARVETRGSPRTARGRTTSPCESHPDRASADSSIATPAPI